MKPVKLAASVLALVTGVLGSYASYTSAAPGGTPQVLTAFGAILIVFSLGCFYGANIAFAGSAIVSGLMLVFSALGWGDGLSTVQWAALALAAINIPLSLLAFKSSTGLSEQANPMNLPVFG